MSHRPFHPSELGDAADPLESASLLLIARELEHLDGGPIRPSDGFTDRVLAAIADEPLPAPMRVAGTAARQGRLGATLAALRDTWQVAWSGGRPFAVRAQAMAFVLLLAIAVGSLSAVTTVGAINVLFSTATPTPTPTLSPTPTLPAVVSPSDEPAPERTVPPAPNKTDPPEPTGTPEPSGTPEPTETPKPNQTDGHTERPGHTETPEPSETPEPGSGGADSGGGHDGGETEKP